MSLINVASEDTSQLLQTALSTESNDNSHGDIPPFHPNLQNTPPVSRKSTLHCPRRRETLNLSFL
jgi:hypothetical protein